jgi:hydroxyacylglutathione hydrolase
MAKRLELIGQSRELELYRLVTEPFGTNAYIVICRETGESVLVDAPGEAEVIVNKLNNTRVKYILLTHGHMDHTMALKEIHGALGAPVAAHENDAAGLPIKPEFLLKDGDKIACGNLRLQVIHTPGHTAGSICFRINSYLLSGDTIFPGGPGKTATPEHFKTIVDSIRKKVLSLPDETIILPGHGASTTVRAERELFEAFISRDLPDQICGDVTWVQ